MSESLITGDGEEYVPVNDRIRLAEAGKIDGNYPRVRGHGRHNS